MVELAVAKWTELWMNILQVTGQVDSYMVELVSASRQVVSQPVQTGSRYCHGIRGNQSIVSNRKWFSEIKQNQDRSLRSRVTRFHFNYCIRLLIDKLIINIVNG